jgi:hypothetical protein
MTECVATFVSPVLTPSSSRGRKKKRKKEKKKRKKEKKKRKEEKEKNL